MLINLISTQKPLKKESKKDAAASKSATKKKPRDDDDDGSKKKKQPKKKKDPNAPKRAMSAFMFFSTTERDVRYRCDYFMFLL